MKKPLKSIVLILVTAIIMFVVPVSADMIARPEIIDPETDFSLNNPEAKKTVTALAYDCDGEIIGSRSTIIMPMRTEGLSCASRITTPLAATDT